MNENKFEGLLRQSLLVCDEPAEALNSQIKAAARLKSKFKEDNLSMTIRKKPAVIAMALIAIICVFSMTAYAVSVLLSADKVAELFDAKAAKAFQTSDAVKINQTKTVGEYDITLLGIAPAKNFTAFNLTVNDKPIIEEDRTIYAAVAIRKTDGTPISELSSTNSEEGEFYCRPMVKGIIPWQNSLGGGGHISTVKDGVLYFLVSCEQLEPFAYTTVYLSVSDKFVYSHDMYIYDESTGDITPNPTYTGYSALFMLPLDESKANRELAQRILENNNGIAAEDSGAEKLNPISTSSLPPISEWTLLPDSVKPYEKNAEGNYTYSYTFKHDSTELTSNMSGENPENLIFDDNGICVLAQGSIDGGRDCYVIAAQRDSSGTITWAFYLLPDSVVFNITQ
ncbi:MAG: hypothetical protein LBS74_01490 [Oscillospiraceae bacterium]|jgi:hypothetical protein|nr:hypothetical protein [Oscillospiraceae bacterium]